MTFLEAKVDLFENSFQSEVSVHQPLAERLRPKSLDEFVGQTKFLNTNSQLLKLIKNRGYVPNLILWGPPGTGKTTFGLLLAQLVRAEFISVNAIETGAKKLREIGQEAHQRKIQYQTATIVFVDEIHRLNRSQQDVLLPFAEKGDFSLVGATTENPSYELNSALLSRSRVIEFYPHEKEDLRILLSRACAHFELELDKIFSEEAQEELIALSNGDARALLGYSEHILSLLQDQILELEGEKVSPITKENLLEFLSGSTLYYDKKSDNHYNTVSAFIKSIRGSDADAALYYLARMVQGGEDPVFIARRLVIAASEDIGNADPRALQIAVSGLEAVRLVGMPEAGINLAQVVTYLASAPKSNRSYLGYKMAMECVKKTGNIEVPLRLQSSQTQLMRSLGRGEGYLYPHDAEKGWVKQSYLPESLINETFYEPSDIGFEKNIKQYENWKKNKESDSVKKSE